MQMNKDGWATDEHRWTQMNGFGGLPKLNFHIAEYLCSSVLICGKDKILYPWASSSGEFR